MAAKAVIVPLITKHIEFWNRFEQLIERGIMEGNTVAGERVWEVEQCSGLTPRLIIRPTSRPAYFLECSLDLESGVLTCKSGSLCGDLLTFRLLDGRSDTLRRNGADYTVEQAIALVLDELVWIEDCGGDAAVPMSSDAH